MSHLGVLHCFCVQVAHKYCHCQKFWCPPFQFFSLVLLLFLSARVVLGLFSENWFVIKYFLKYEGKKCRELLNI